MKIGIICALDTELQPYLPHIKDCTQTTKAKLTFYEGVINDIKIAAVVCGVGKTNAALATQILIDSYGATGVVNSGTAGGMNPMLNLFDIVICTEAIHHDVEGGVLNRFIPWLTSAAMQADAAFLTAAKAVAMEQYSYEGTVHTGVMVTGDKFIVEDGRAEIISQFAPLTVDMETASIAQVCYVNEVPYISIRTITDTAKDSGEDNFTKNCPAASEISKKFVLKMLGNV